jgi:hypothetical protein
MRIIIALLLALNLSGCGMLLGVKEIRTAGGTHIKFNSGFGAEASFSESDTLDNRRAMK